MAKAKKNVYFFGGKRAEGNSRMRNLLGGKGSNIAEMSNIGIPVPPGFTITTEVCAIYYEKKGRYPAGLREEVARNLGKVEHIMGAEFGDPRNPLLVSVRSGARISMPGMMDTVLNIGLNDKTVQGFISQTGNERAAYDSYRRFVQMYGNVVMGVPGEEFGERLDRMKEERGAKSDTDLRAEDFEELVSCFKEVARKKTGKDFPEKPMDQLWGAIGAVFGSWDTPRAVSYRKINRIPDDWGTAVNVQAMVFGNMGTDSGTGVAFTRDPATGENVFYGEYLLDAQGEDVVAGIRNPRQINVATKKEHSQPSLEEEMPRIYRELVRIRNRLEKHYRDMQDIEFTIQKGKLWMLQTRTGKRTAVAAIRMAVEMVGKGQISREQAVGRLDPDQLSQLLHPMFDPQARREVIAKGLNASPGAAVGKIVFDADEAAQRGEAEKLILVRLETSPEDIHGMAVAQGILTARGGMTSHAAVVARGMGKCCVAGCSAINIDYAGEQMTVDGRVLEKNTVISLDGSTGEVMLGEVKVIDSEITQVARGQMDPEESEIYPYYRKLMSWADKVRRLGVRTNADLPEDSRLARQFGAEGIGLTRTEHMFFAEDRLPVVQRMILADSREEREKAADELMPMQKNDFKEILEAMDGLPVIIRLLDPPLHEFLPKHEELAVEIAILRFKGGDAEEIKKKQALLAQVERLAEMNPMLGHRGCRLGITFPEVYRMQAKAIMEAAAELIKEGKNPVPEIMIPLVGEVNELRLVKKDVTEAAEETLKAHDIRINYMVGTMIELPRAALTADEIAKEAEFFSYGTNDLTQMTFGFSRDDIEGKFLPVYIEKKVLAVNPFAILDQTGVGELVRIGIERGRSTRPRLEIGICGEHGGEPSSVRFCHRVGMDYVSCSPYRVPIARLAAAQAVLEEKQGSKGASRAAPRKKTRKTGKSRKAREKKTRKVKKGSARVHRKGGRKRRGR